MNIDEGEVISIIIEVYAKQFNWKAGYVGNDNVLGSANVRLIDIDKNNMLGVDENDPYADDDVVSQTEIHLPVGRKVIFKMRSQDVLHSAFMPHFRAQMNVVPGMITQFAFTPSVTTADMRMDPDMVEKVNHINQIRADRKADGEVDNVDPWQFDYVLLCNKICGSSHYNMQMKIIVETQEEFDAWIKEQDTFKQQMAAAQ